MRVMSTHNSDSSFGDYIDCDVMVAMCGGVLTMHCDDNKSQLLNT